MAIEDIVINLSYGPFNPRLNFDAAIEYERLEQTASALSFYLRTVEYGDLETDKLIMYAALLKMSSCLDRQADRTHSVTNAILQAIALDPVRPEGYFLMAQFHERKGNWQECYTWASMGEARVIANDNTFPVDIGYYGPYCFTFEKAVSAWWIGRKEEAIELFKELKAMDIEPEYAAAVGTNLTRIQADL